MLLSLVWNYFPVWLLLKNRSTKFDVSTGGVKKCLPKIFVGRCDVSTGGVKKCLPKIFVGLSVGLSRYAPPHIRQLGRSCLITRCVLISRAELLR